MTADLDECFRLAEWSQFSVILVLRAMTELEVVSQHEIKGFIYMIQICHCSVNSKVIEYEISSQEDVISDDHT